MKSITVGISCIDASYIYYSVDYMGQESII